MPDMLFDSYSECYWTQEQVARALAAYLAWCKTNGQTPEVTELEFVGLGNIGHVVYHACLHGWDEQGQPADAEE